MSSCLALGLGFTTSIKRPGLQIAISAPPRKSESDGFPQNVSIYTYIYVKGCGGVDTQTDGGLLDRAKKAVAQAETPAFHLLELLQFAEATSQRHTSHASIGQRAFERGVCGVPQGNIPGACPEPSTQLLVELEGLGLYLHLDRHVGIPTPEDERRNDTQTKRILAWGCKLSRRT